MGQSSKLRFNYDSAGTPQRVLVAVPPDPVGAALCRELEQDGHSVCSVGDVASLLFALELIADRLGPAPNVLIVDIRLAGGHALESVRHFRRELRKASVFVLGDDLDHDELNELEHDGVVVFRPPLDRRDVRYAVAHTEYWRFMRPSRAFFDRVGHRRKRED